jgi:CMP-N-acetylneuraminic acid synthetase
VDKNVKPINGVPLLAFSYFTAQKCKERGIFSDVLVSTDSRDYLKTLAPLGYGNTYLRPADLASDSSPTLDAVRHALEWFRESGREFDAVMILQPTAPFRTPDHVEHAVRMLAENPDATCVAGVAPLGDAHPARIKRLVDGKWLTDWCDHAIEPEPSRRQDFTPPAFIRNGTIYLVPIATLARGLIRGERVLGIEMHEANSANVDDHKDFLLAQTALTYDGYAEQLSFFKPLIEIYRNRND